MSKARASKARVSKAGATVAVVTGAGGSLGRAIARRLAADGHVVAVTDVDGAGLDQTRAAVQADGGEACAWPVDLRDADAITRFFAAVAAGPGPAAVLVNNAAIYPATPFLDTGVAEYDDVHAINQRGYWLCAQSAARQMQTAGAGAIVNIASITMHGGWANLASYVATKGAAAALTRALARELGQPASGSTRCPPARSRPRPSRSTMTRPRTTSTCWISSR